MQLVELKKGKPVISSKVVAEQLGRDHKIIMNLIRTYKDDLEEINTLALSKCESKLGRPEMFYYLDEEQLSYLMLNMISLKKDGDKVRYFKKKMNKEFYRMREALFNLKMQRAEPEWIETRTKGKEIRLQETDEIKRFVQYCFDNGSTNGTRYYQLFTDMVYKELFITKLLKKGLLEHMNEKQLNETNQAYEIVSKAIEDKMPEKMYYKEIFKYARSQVAIFAGLKGKSIIPSPSLIGAML